jgi:ubiquinone/menaquinone biosynthesis C-methylase UbiE
MSGRPGSIKQHYRDSDHAGDYNNLRFANAGGKLVDAWEKEILSDLLEGYPLDQPILEVAAGTGRFSLMLARRGYTVIAVDSSPEMLNQLEETATAEGLNISCIHADAFNLPFDDGTFHGVFSMRFAWHFADVSSVIHELARVAEKTVVFDLMNQNSLAALTAPLANHVFYRSLHTELTTRGKADAILRSAGLGTVVKKCAFIFPYIFYRRLPLLSKVLHAIDRAILQWVPFGLVLYFNAEKKNRVEGQPDRAS